MWLKETCVLNMYLLQITNLISSFHFLWKLLSNSHKKILLSERKRHTDRRVASAALSPGGRGGGGEGVPNLEGGYLPWMGGPTPDRGVPTLDRGYLSWMGGYLPWKGVPTLDRVYLPWMGCLQWTEVPTLDGGDTYPGWGYLPWTEGTYPGWGAYSGQGVPTLYGGG